MVRNTPEKQTFYFFVWNILCLSKILLHNNFPAYVGVKNGKIIGAACANIKATKAGTGITDVIKQIRASPKVI